SKHGAMLVFDEVMSGFRVALGSAQSVYARLIPGFKPDMSVFGKVIGGGLPVGAYGGRRDIMELIAPLGPVYQAGTLSGNPLAMAAGIATLELLQDGGAYEQLEGMSARLASGLERAARDAGVTVRSNRVGSVMTLFFTGQPVTDWTTAATSDRNAYGVYFRSMLDQGVYLAPSQFEAAFVSLAHTSADIEETLAAAENAFAAVKAME
ncbi:MAG: aminotransferase class III-fold pyridoxal phosphate-dependent enzyme, partial [Chloroflexi bacterium]|nr:aminotransferase class III-fold pyridoxal phosphate-dependent enzyme [Chloroflexota bacterium]